MIIRVLFSVVAIFCIACTAPMNNVSGDSGFLGDEQDYAVLKFDSRSKLYKHLSSEKVLTQYKSYSVAPIQVLASSDSQVFIEDREVEKLAEEFRGEIIKALGNSYSHLNTPAKDKAEIRIALTGVDANSLVGSLRPGLLVKRSGLGGAKMEAEIIDSVTGKRVATFMDSRQGRNDKYFQGLTKWGSSDEAFRAWAGLVRRFLRSEG